MHLKHSRTLGAVAAIALLGLAGCSDNDNDHAEPAPQQPPPVAQLPQLSPAVGATLGACTELATRVNIPDTIITAANQVAAGVLTVAGKPVAAHCQVLGQMFRRVSPVDGKSYAIGFEMRLPTNWNGRFFYRPTAASTAASSRQRVPWVAAARWTTRSTRASP